MADRPVLKIGCCGFAKAHADYYAQFDVVEIQQTFYQPPRPGTLTRWRDEAPPGFEFTLKAWQPITHPATSPTWCRLKDRPERPDEAGYFRPSAAVEAAWERTREAAELLQAGILLFQCPASFGPDEQHLANMRRFFSTARRGGLRFAWEPRGAGPDGLIAELCRDLDFIHCVNPLTQSSVRAGIAYFRLHGVTGYRYRHDENDLRKLMRICEPHEEAYCLFNNMTMFDDALRFRKTAGQSRAGAT